MSKKPPLPASLNNPEGLLVRIKIKLCDALNVNPATLRVLIDQYVNRHYDRTSVKTHFTKVNLYNELSSDKMTVKTFINKFLRVLMIKKFEITIKVTTVRDKEVSVTETVYLANQETKGETDADENKT